MDLQNFITEEVLIIIPVLIVLGKIIKETKTIPDKFIPFILLGLGVVFSLGTIGLTVPSVIQGILVSGAAVFGHQLFKQGKKPS